MFYVFHRLQVRRFGLSTDAFPKSVKNFLKIASQESGFGVSSFFFFIPSPSVIIHKLSPDTFSQYIYTDNFDSNFLRFIEQTGITCKNSLPNQLIYATLVLCKLSACIHYRGTQRLFSVKYLFGEANIAQNFLLLEG